MHPALEHGLIGSFRLFPLPRRLHLRGYSSALFTALVLLPVHTVQPIFLTVSFPTSSFCSISQCDLPSMVPPYTLPAPPPPTVFMLHVFYLYPLPATVKLIALCTAPLATPQTTHAPLTVAGMQPPKITLDWARVCLQVPPQQRRLMQPIFIAPWCVFSTSTFPPVFIIWFEMQSWMWGEVVHIEEELSGLLFLRRRRIISSVVISSGGSMSSYGNGPWHPINTTPTSRELINDIRKIQRYRLE